ncbi:recombinase family protein [Streptomyces sp. NPDC005551]|uniref:recombinase family protein n=1 Tax=Streptomyces sp. NPDC005551 TaxID=3364725 RepID=UPI0036998C3E
MKSHIPARPCADIRRESPTESHSIPANSYPLRKLSRGRGRPPYGFRTAVVLDGTGQRRQLVPDEHTAPVVRRIFDECLDGRSLQSIAEGLNADRVPSPGPAGPNAARAASAWSKSTVRAILLNPRYAGRHAHDGAADDAAGRQLVPSDVFEEVHAMFAKRRKPSGECGAEQPKPYALRGLLRCGRCNRLMQGTWNNGEPYYRCRVPAAEDAACTDHPRNVYLREQAVIGPLVTWLRGLTAPQGLRRLMVAGGGHHAGAAARHQLRSLGVDGELRASALQALGVRLSYSDSGRLLDVKAVLGPEGLVVRTRIAL